MAALDPPSDVDSEQLDRLYGGPPDRFTEARNELARALARDGNEEAATWVRGLKRPTVAAALVNRLSRERPDGVAALLRAGEELRRAQARLIEGSASGDELRSAAQAEREAVDRLTEAARDISDEAGGRASDQTMQRVVETLQAVGADEEARRLVAEGRLDVERRSAALGEADLAAAAARAPGPGRAAAGVKRELSQQQRARERLRDEVEAAEEKVDLKRRALDAARERAVTAESELKRAKEALRERKSELRTVDRKLRALEKRQSTP